MGVQGHLFDDKTYFTVNHSAEKDVFFPPKHPTKTHTSDALNTEKPECMTGTSRCQPAGFGRSQSLSQVGHR